MQSALHGFPYSAAAQRSKHSPWKTCPQVAISANAGAPCKSSRQIEHVTAGAAVLASLATGTAAVRTASNANLKRSRTHLV